MPEQYASSPFAQFDAWMAEAVKAEVNDPNAMVVATCTPDGHPSARAVLLKGVDPKGFVFYTNKTSRKGDELAANGKIALLFYWKSLHRQIRIEGVVEDVTDAEADAYYASRARISRLGGPCWKAAWRRWRRGSLGKIFPGRPTGRAIASCRHGSNSGRTCRTDCTTVQSITAMPGGSGARSSCSHSP
jgi:hypothetical protein